MKGSVVVAFSSASNCKLSDLGLIVDGDGDQTSGSTTQTSLRADCANSNSATNVKMWASFAPNSRDMTFSPTPTSNAFTLSSNTYITATMAYASPGTFYQSRVMTPNTSWLGTKWSDTRTSGNDTTSNYTRTSTTYRWLHTLVDEPNTDIWVIKQVVPSSTAFERFFCDASGNQTILSETITIYDTSGGGGGF